MRRASLLLALVSTLAACEEGPDQIYKPNPPNFDPKVINGWRPTGVVLEGEQPFQAVASGQKTGTVKICEADELARRWTEMVKKPIEPTKGAGGLNLRGQPEWAGLSIDQAQQILCQAYVYDSEIYVWGDNAELIAMFDSKTRLIDRLVTLTGYEGTISAGPYLIANNKAVSKNGKAIANEQGLIPDEELRLLNIELLKKFRPGEVPNVEQRDCVALGTCYAMDWYTLKRFVFNDLQLDFATDPDKKINHIGVNLRRDFEFGKGAVNFVMTPAPALGLPPLPRIEYSKTCQPTLGDSWAHIKQNCLGIDPEAKALSRPVWANEAMVAEMGGLAVYMVRPSLPADQILADGERPQPTDTIVGMGFGTSYEGKLKINRTELLESFAVSLAARVKALVPSVDVLLKLQKLSPVGTPEEMAMGTQKVKDGNAADVETTLTQRAAKIVQTEVKAATGSLPEPLKDPNFYVEVFLRELLAVFNEYKPIDPNNTYFFPGSDTADVLYGRTTRQIGNERYAISVVYHNKSDQLLSIFFKRGVLRTEAVLYKNADVFSGGVFTMTGLVNSKVIGLGKVMKPIDAAAVNKSIQRAMVTVKLSPPVNVLVAYHEKDALSGYSIPIEGQRDLFVPAAYYGFAGNNVGASFWTGDLDENTSDVILAISSGSFYDKVSFCGVKVGLYDRVDELLKAVPASCDKIITYSANGKLIYAVTTYVASGTSNIGLRLYVTAGRIDGAYYWME